MTEWLFYYVADWPQPSNIWTCMCGSFLQAPLLIISVLLVTFSFSHSAFSLSLSKNTLYLDTSLFVFLHTKPVCVSQGIKKNNHTWACHSDCYSFDSIIINFVIIAVSVLGIVTLLFGFCAEEFSVAVAVCFYLLLLFKLRYWFERKWTCEAHHFLCTLYVQECQNHNHIRRPIGFPQGNCGWHYFTL